MTTEQALSRAPEGAPDVLTTIGGHVRTRPGSPALSAGGETITYGRLWEWSDVLARRLLAAGLRPGAVGAVCLEPSAGFVAAALAVMKTGAAYLPLDPEYPAARIAFMLEDSGARALITTARLRQLLNPAVPVIKPDRAGEASAGGCAPAGAPAPDDLAYLIYTSGSTGRPKGVEIPHRGLANLIAWHLAAFGLGPEDRASQLAGLGFDAAVWEIWPCLAAGARMSIPPEGVRQDAARLRAWLLDEKITVAFAPTAIAEPLLEMEWPASTALRLLLTGGEALGRYPRPGLPFSFVNNYGPTEATVVATSGAVPAGGAHESPPSIGRPIANTEIFLLDSELRPVADGAAGEMFIGGAGLARGYRNRPELTAERFIPSPFHTGGERLYRTGDLARRRPDGELEFLGRADDQVKIRGYRIEPNEVAAALAAHESVARCAVVAREDAPGEKSLAAYLVAREAGAVLSQGELRDFLRRTLPEYMIPAQFVLLESLPLTPNGKIDRRALPEPTRDNTLPNSGDAAPRTALEQQIAATLAELLKLDRIGVDDNFFLLGGHSLLGAQLIARLRDQFDVEVPLRTLFEAPTVASLASEVERLVVEKVNAMSDEDVSRLLR